MVASWMLMLAHRSSYCSSFVRESTRATTRMSGFRSKTTPAAHYSQQAMNNCNCCTVESILGVPEMDLVQLSSADRRLFVSDDDRCFVHRGTKHCTPFGKFELVNIDALRRRVEALTGSEGWDHGERGSGSSSLQSPPRLTIQSGVDIGQLQSTLRTDDHAMVQVASNFNCLENPSIATAANCGYLVDNACRDRTQGPAAVFGPLSAYLYRAHFVEVRGGDDNESQHIGQTQAKGINLLQDVAQYFGTPVNGKLLLQGDETPVGLDDATPMDTVVDQVCIGLHTNVPVLFGRDSAGLVVPMLTNDDTSYPTVDQVFSASVDVHACGRMSRACLRHSQEDQDQAVDHMARTLLRAAYEGLYLAALVQQRRQLYLTLVGGGSFGNRIELILEEMKRAHDKWAGHPASHLELCQICVFSKTTEEEVQRCFG